MPKVDVRELDFIDDDYVGYEKIRKTPKKEIKPDEKPKSEPKKSDVRDN
tara:strand:+ start:306 stop:452 length:147 start_codon:yes stop_codon:yes gene_type:complete